jgi:hypothetical protein
VNKTDDERVQELMKRVEVNDAGAMTVLGSNYYHGQLGLQHDWARAMELWKQAGILGSHALGNMYHEGGNSKKEKFHYEAAAMAGHEVARLNLGAIEMKSRNSQRAVKHWTIAASTGNHTAMKNILIAYNQGHGISRHEIDLTLTAYNNACAEMRSKARDAFIRMTVDRIGGR